MAGLAESGLQNLDHGDRDSKGVFQQRPSQGWGTDDQVQNVDYAIGKYYDALQGVAGRESMSEAQMAQAVQRSAFADGSNYQAQAAEADKYLAGYSGGGTSDSGSASDLSAVSSTGGVQDVFVTNWPDGLGGTPAATDAQKPKAIATARFYADGGVENHTAQIAQAGAMRVWAEPETGGEAYIPLGVAKRARSRAIWRETGKRLGIRDFADGGFGGYSGPDTTDYMKPRNLYEAASLATGLGFTAASVFGNYLDMASSGTVDLSNLMPQFDTSSNSIPGLDKAFQQMPQQLEGILETLKKGGLVKVDADVNTSTGAVGIKFDAAGIA